MEGNINAFGIIGVALFAIFLIIRYGKMPERISNIFLGIFYGICGILMVILGLKSLGKGFFDLEFPFLQWLVPTISLMCIRIFIVPKRVRIISIMVVIFAAIILSLQFLALVHSSKYAGVKKPTVMCYYSSQYKLMCPSESQRPIENGLLWHTKITGLYLERAIEFRERLE